LSKRVTQLFTWGYSLGSVDFRLELRSWPYWP